MTLNITFSVLPSNKTSVKKPECYEIVRHIKIKEAQEIIKRKVLAPFPYHGTELLYILKSVPYKKINILDPFHFWQTKWDPIKIEKNKL